MLRLREIAAFFREMTALALVMWLVLGGLTLALRALSSTAALLAVVSEQVANASSHGRTYLRRASAARPDRRFQPVMPSGSTR
ncbi:hypothetical protein [Allokutzneria oryzae]|uniref:Uncharacterized protein n=1 Tax=Allokutzneria oryzae TaxID=1378989 RepID=A0ABV6A2X3_9PSEU